MAGLDLGEMLGNLMNGGALQGVATTVMRQAGFTEDQIETVMTIREEHPNLANIDFMPLMAEDAQPLRDQFLPLLQDEDLVAKLDAALGEDPDLVNNINHLIRNNPDRLTEIAAQLQADENASVSELLTSSVTPEEASAAANNDAGFGGMLQEFLGDFDMENIGGNLLQLMGTLLVGLQNMVMPLIGGIMNSLSSLGSSGDLIQAGNGHPETGAGAQARTLVMNDGAVYNQEGDRVATIHVPGTQQPPQQPDPADPNRTPGMTAF